MNSVKPSLLFSAIFFFFFYFFRISTSDNFRIVCCLRRAGPRFSNTEKECTTLKNSVPSGSSKITKCNAHIRMDMPLTNACVLQYYYNFDTAKFFVAFLCSSCVRRWDFARMTGWNQTVVFLLTLTRRFLCCSSFSVCFVIVCSTSLSFGASGRLCFVIVAFPGYLYLYFCMHLFNFLTFSLWSVQKFAPHRLSISDIRLIFPLQNTVELQWLKHVCAHVNVFAVWAVRAIEG